MDKTANNILVVDDDARVRRMLRRCLEDEGYSVTEASNPEDVAAAMNGHIDLITLDLNLGGTDGLAIAREIRGTSNIPIIIISGKGEMVDRVVGLEVGADDYIAKPFHLREVLARVRSVLRRAHPATAAAATQGEVSSRCYTFDGYAFDLDRRTLHRPDGSPCPLTATEFDLLSVFVRHAHHVLDRDRIMDLTKGHDWTPTDRSIDNQIVRLRRKIEADPTSPVLLQTVRGAGYSFTPERLEKR